MEKEKRFEHLSNEYLEHRKQHRMGSYMYIEWVVNMIDNDLKDFIFQEWVHDIFHSKDEALKSFYDNRNNELMKIEEHIDPELWKEDLAEIEFLRQYIKELLKTYYDNRRFSEVFESEKIKEKFIELLKKYLYTDEECYHFMTTDFVLGKLSEKYPKHNWILTADEIDKLLDKWLSKQKKD